MSRYPAIPPSDLTPDQRVVYDATSSTCEALFGPKWLYKDKNDAFVGPFAPNLYTPTLMQPYIQLAVELSKFEEIPAAARETAILATGSTFQADFELYAHKKLSLLRNVLSSAQIEAITRGEKPSGNDKLSNECEVAFDVTIELTTKRGPLSDGSYDKLVQAFGKVGALALIHYVGLYSYTCILLNGVAAPVPE